MQKQGSSSDGQSRSLRRNGRLRWVVLFTLLLLNLSVVPVLAAGASQEISPEAPSPSPAEPIAAELPDGDDVRAGIKMAEQEEAERERWLRSSEAVRQREESRFAFAKLSAAQAQELLLSIFSTQLEKLNTDPARFLSDVQLVRPLGEGETAATVRDEADGSLLESSMPVRVEDETGELRKVDLSLEPTPGGFRPANPIAEIHIPGSIDQAVEIGDEGLAVSGLGTVGDSDARLLGDKNVFYPEALGADSGVDRLISPISGGVEIFDLIRSADSPEEVRFRIDLPKGAELRSDGNGGAGIFRGDQPLASIPFPHATDAQGTYVPVDLRIEGDAIILHVPHRDADVAYPLLLDPAITEDWYNYNWFNGHNHQALTNGSWGYTESHAWIESSTYCIYACWGVGRGLFVSMPNGAHWGQQYGHWAYSAPNTNSYLVNAWANPFVRNDHGCSKANYPEPHDYLGMWHNNTWNRFLNDQAITYGYSDIQSWGSTFILGLATGNGSATPCWRDLAVGGAAIWLDDWQSPTVNSVTGVPSGWLSDTSPDNINVNASDSGLGVYRATVTPEGKGAIPKLVGCTGLYGNRCPTSTGVGFNLTGLSFGEGVRNANVAVEDPTGKTAAGSPFQTKVDRTPPEVTLSGQLAQETNEGGSSEQPPGEGDELSLPVYNLTINATDVGTESNVDHKKRSGVKDIEIWLGGKELEVPWSPQSCPNSSCPMTQTYQLKLSTLTTAGEYTLEVKVKDQVGNVRLRKIEFEYIPATGIKDEYVMHYFPLPDGLGNEAEEEHPDRPELAVNVMNGNLVYREQDVELAGAAVNLEVERYYNSMLPDAENTEWGDGWTLAQTPDLKPLDTGGSPAPDEAELLDSSGTIKDRVQLPTEAGQKKFDPTLRTTLTMKSSGGYEMTDETGESPTSVAFDETGQTEALLTEGYAKVDYTYEGGELAEIEVTDPATFAADPAELEIPESGLIPEFSSAFGSGGTGNGQFDHPADVALTAAGQLLLADSENHRIQRFDQDGKYLGQFGTYGAGNGQFFRPSGVAVAPNGDILVAEPGNDRIQRLDSAGKYLSMIGSWGESPGKFKNPEGIAVEPDGEIWVSDNQNHRLQKFSAQGAFLKAIGTSGPGDLDEPRGIDIGPGGEVVVADEGNERVVVFDSAGEYLRSFAIEGPSSGLDVDAAGNVWVADRANEWVERFHIEGAFLGRFGTEGEGEGEFELESPTGIETDSEGRIWVTDSQNNRVQRWEVPGTNIDLSDGDPKVEVETEGGLITSLEGNAAGEHSYEHNGNFLTSHDGPQGETVYEKDSAGRLSKVTLPNGTWGSIAYYSDGRVKSVTVDPAGSAPAKKTEFEYTDAPTRRTVVIPPDAPHVTYDIGEDGSVLRWWNALQPPTFDDLAGSLYENKEEEGAIWAGDHYLDVQAHSEEGIASIEVIANGSQLVHETTCEQTEAPGIECKTLISEWVTNTELHAPGHLNVEVLLTDRLGQSASERFWVDIPEPPPPPAPGTPIPPKFADILSFRDDYGLEIIFPVANEIVRNERIFNLINAWYEGEPVARASWEKWGVPLRPADVAELEYRERYIDNNVESIEAWAEANYPGTYAGYYVDHPAGGTLHVGFTQNQVSRLSDLKAQLALEAEDRLTVYATPPSTPRVSLASAYETLDAALDTNSTLRSLVTDISISESGNDLSIGTTNVAQTQAIVIELIGSQVPVDFYIADAPVLTSGRYRTTGRMRAGDKILNEDSGCTAAFGAFEERTQKSNGQKITARFVLTAGHCFSLDASVFRSDRADFEDSEDWAIVGQVTRNAFHGNYGTDGLAIRSKMPDLVPRGIFGSDGNLVPTGTATRAQVGNTLCYSGVTLDGVSCGEVKRKGMARTGDIRYGVYVVKFRKRVDHGDSGGPVWNPRTGSSVGVVTGFIPGTPYSIITPLLHPKGLSLSRVPGILHHPEMFDMQIITGN